MIKIEKRIPIPLINRGRKNIYPFGEMKDGDSFLVDKRRAVSAAAAQYSKRHPEAKFAIRKVADGFRVWRIT